MTNQCGTKPLPVRHSHKYKHSQVQTFASCTSQHMKTSNQDQISSLYFSTIDKFVPPSSTWHKNVKWVHLKTLLLRLLVLFARLSLPSHCSHVWRDLWLGDFHIGGWWGFCWYWCTRVAPRKQSIHMSSQSLRVDRNALVHTQDDHAFIDQQQCTYLSYVKKNNWKCFKDVTRGRDSRMAKI